ncbi:MAG TPA: diguanylate cyclase [Planctomycetota bacterium]|nr:diguanylate cyclase [Planctomycetota bacterium]
MADGLRTVRVVTADESLLASVRAAAKALEGWDFASVESLQALLARAPVAGDVLLLDGRLRDVNVYEACRRLAGQTRCRTFVVVDAGNALSEPIARFCGATGTLERPLTAAVLRAALERGAPSAERPDERRSQGRKPELPEALLADLSGGSDSKLVAAVTDPETKLFNYAFLTFKLDEEFKRAQRFDHPLSCVMLGFEGQASESVLRELAGIFLVASRDTDVLGRFDENSFLFLLPNTGQDGAEIMARRVEEQASRQGLRDLVGDPLTLAVGIAYAPHSEVRRKEDLFARCRQAFFSARQEGGGVVTSA